MLASVVVLEKLSASLCCVGWFLACMFAGVCVCAQWEDTFGAYVLEKLTASGCCVGLFLAFIVRRRVCHSLPIPVLVRWRTMQRLT